MRLARLALYAIVSSALLAVVVSVGCSSDAESGGSANTSGTLSSGNGAASGVGGAGQGGTTASTASYTTGSSGAAPTQIATCQGHVYQCGDLMDNDGDGLIDSQDPDCLGPCDDTEDSYYGGIPGQAGNPCLVDCYFDQDSGSGNDDCHWNHQCDPNEVAPNYYPEQPYGSMCSYNSKAMTPGAAGKSCDDLYNAQSQQCLNYCGPLTPNGCDCFGCCELPAGSGSYVWLGSDSDTINGGGTCDLAHVLDPTKCQPCLPVKACLNTCDHCELCIGKDTLPADCGGGTGGTGGSGTGGSGGGTQQCPTGSQACGLAGQAPCPTNYYCITGCCQPVPA